MPKPVKIKKKKSFMFTTKHHSFLGILGFVLAILSISSFVWNTYYSFINRGIVPENYGAVGFFAVTADILGIISGFVALNERDIHRWLPITAIVSNFVIAALWVFLIAIGIRGV